MYTEKRIGFIFQSQSQVEKSLLFAVFKPREKGYKSVYYGARTVQIVRKSILSFTIFNIEQGTAFQKLENLQRNIRVGRLFSGLGVNMILCKFWRF